MIFKRMNWRPGVVTGTTACIIWSLVEESPLTAPPIGVMVEPLGLVVQVIISGELCTAMVTPLKPEYSRKVSHRCLGKNRWEMNRPSGRS